MIDSPAGDVLVVSEAGQVVCRVRDRILSADPGSMVEISTLDHGVSTHPLNLSTVDSAVSTWVAARRAVFRDQAEAYFQTLGTRFLWQGGLFQRAWERVAADSKDDSKSTQAATANLRRAAFPLERSVFRIAALRGLLDEGILSPSVELTRGYTAKDFFAQADTDSGALSTRLVQARSLYRVLADRNGGDFPRTVEGSAVSWDSDFFH